MLYINRQPLFAAEIEGAAGSPATDSTPVVDSGSAEPTLGATGSVGDGAGDSPSVFHTFTGPDGKKHDFRDGDHLNEFLRTGVLNRSQNQAAQDKHSRAVKEFEQLQADHDKKAEAFASEREQYDRAVAILSSNPQIYQQFLNLADQGPSAEDVYQRGSSDITRQIAAMKEEIMGEMAPLKEDRQAAADAKAKEDMLDDLDLEGDARTSVSDRLTTLGDSKTVVRDVAGILKELFAFQGQISPNVVRERLENQSKRNGAARLHSGTGQPPRGGGVDHANMTMDQLKEAAVRSIS